jgi:L-lysine exporter family protein LysE/ArgO
MEMILRGALISGGLIMAIGAQNAFVLKQGLLKRHIFWVSLTCFLCDIALMSLGVFGLGSIISTNPYASAILAIVGALFLSWYGLRAFSSALRATSFLDAQNAQAQAGAISAAVSATLAITLLNPHVYLDTVVVVGGIAGTLSFDQKLFFLLGALLASGTWFFALGYGARLLLPLFRKARTWQVLDFVIAAVMWWIAYELGKFGLLNFPH